MRPWPLAPVDPCTGDPMNLWIHAMTTRAHGYTLVEAVIAVALVVIVGAMSVPGIASSVARSRVRGAAFHIAGRIAALRMQAARRGANVALRFQPDGIDYRYQVFADGNGDGVSSADIGAGRDIAVGSSERLGDIFTGVRFGLSNGCPLTDGARAPDSNPVRIGSSTLLSVSPLGTATSGSLYLRDATGTFSFAVVVLGATGRTTLLGCDNATGRWSANAR